MTAITRYVLHHRRRVVTGWVLIALAAFATLPQLNRSLSKNLTVPGREGFVTNQEILHAFHNGGLVPPLVVVVRVPPGAHADAPAAEAQLSAALARVHHVLPVTRVVSYAQTHNDAFLSPDRRTIFALIYPPPGEGQPGQNLPAVRAVQRTLAASTVDGAGIGVTGIDALQATTHAGGGGLGVLVEVLLGALGALAVLAFVFASLIALLPLLIALVSIPTTFLIVLALTKVTAVNANVQFLVASIGLGVAIDYALLIVARWREERASTDNDEKAIITTMRTAGRAVAFSGLTVAVGLLSLIVLPLPFLRSVGYAGMLIPLVSVAVTTTLLPVALATIAPPGSSGHGHGLGGVRAGHGPRGARSSCATACRRSRSAPAS